MNIAWFTEGNWTGKVKRTHTNMRNDAAWMCILDAEHYSLNTPVRLIDKKYELGIVTIPKRLETLSDKENLIRDIKTVCKKVAFMQEGPHWYFQDYNLADQIWYYNTLGEMDVIFVHNYDDLQYYFGLFPNIKIEVMPTLMLTDNLNIEWSKPRTGVMIGGNMCSWYGGFDSYIVAQEFNSTIFAPSMGRRIEGEETLGITHYPFMPWHQWINELNKCKYAVHLMRTKAAGTFALNCAFLGIPCIGYSGVDTQEQCFPALTVRDGDITLAREYAKSLANEPEFYESCVAVAKHNYSNFDETSFIKHFKEIYDSII